MLELRNVTKIYRSKSGDTAALRKVNLSFKDNGLVFIVGKSGLRSLDDVTFQNLLRKELNLTVGEELHITNELEEEFKSRMMSTPSYQDILEKGAETIKKWI